MQIARKESTQQALNEIDNLIKVQQIMTQIQENMEEALRLFIGLWKELQDESPNFQYLGKISQEITSLVAKVRASYKRLIFINPANLYCRMLYALFLKRIVKDDFEAFEVNEE